MSDPFAGIRGQDAAVALLRRALGTGHVAHAYAFVGPAGSGRKTAALALAQALVAPAGGRAAGRVARGVHPDVHLIAPTPPEDRPKGPVALRIENVRELERLAALRPAEAPVKVFIVDEAERMTASAPQAFLKTLEEPPARTVIVLILSQLRALPATVLSRCQIVRFLPAVPAEGPALLPEGQGEDRARALQWLEEARAPGGEAILAAGERVGRDREMAAAAVQTWWLWYRDLLCLGSGAREGLAVFRDRAGLAVERGAAMSLDEIVSGLRGCREAWQALEGNVSPRLTVEVLLSRLAQAQA
jgi:DNA polymerase-3 subunit delta'